MLALAALLAWQAGPHASLSPPPKALIAGQAWRAKLVVRPAPAQRVAPTVLARPATGRALVFAARRAGRGRYRVRLVLPRAGAWRLAVLLGRRSLPFGSSPFARCRRRSRRCRAPLRSGSAPALTIPYPQYALAVGFGSAWVACVRQGEVLRVSLSTGKITARIPLPVSVWSITAGEGAVWAAALGGSVVYRINPGRTGRGSDRARHHGALPLGRRRRALGRRRSRPGDAPCRPRDEPPGGTAAGRRRSCGLRLRRHLRLGAESPRELARPDRPGDEHGGADGQRDLAGGQLGGRADRRPSAARSG